MTRAILDAADRRRLFAAADELARLAAEIPSPYPDRAAYNAAIVALTERLTTRPDARATINARWDGASISMLGFRASSTSGLVGACRNWVTQVREKAAAHA